MSTCCIRCRISDCHHQTPRALSNELSRLRREFDEAIEEYIDSLESVREALHSLMESSASPRRVEEVVGARLWEIEAHEHCRATTKELVAAQLGYSSYAQIDEQACETTN
jgi:hypothetical protein